MTDRTVKAFLVAPDGCNGEIRRFILSPETVRPGVTYSFTKFILKITSIFPALTGKSFKLTWKDEEGDDIVMSSDEELMEAMQSMPQGILKVYVHCACSSANCPASEKKSSEKPLHLNILCDGCDSQIRGNRFKCLECEDYDLCETCLGKDKHPEHNMVRIADPSRPGSSQWFPLGRGKFWKSFARHPKFHHGRGHKKREEARTPGGLTADACTAAAEQGEEFLRFIGERMAAFLDPLGIDVSVDVEHSGPSAEVPSAASKEAPPSTQPKDVNCDVEMTPQTVPQEETQATPSPLSSGTTHASQSHSKSSKDSDGEGDWTMVTEGATANPDAQNAMETGQSPSVAAPCQPPLIDLLSHHPDPKVSEVIAHMISMGFSNDGGWLSRLVESKGGNMEAVLDTLHPAHSVPNRNKF